jgi:hypothetical protein
VAEDVERRVRLEAEHPLVVEWKVKMARHTGCTMGPSSCRMASSRAMVSRRDATSTVPSAAVSSRSNSALEYFDSFQGTPER